MKKKIFGLLFNNEQDVKNSVYIILTILISVLYNTFYEYKLTKNIIINRVIEIILPLSIVLSIYILLKILYNHLCANQSFRKIVFPLGKYEGDWITKVASELRPISIFRISYNNDKKKYEYSGTAYNHSGKHMGDWHSDELYIFPDGFKFYATGHYYSDDKYVTTESSGQISLKEIGKTLSSTGYTIDWNSKEGCLKTESLIIDKNLLISKINKEEIECENDLLNLITAMHREGDNDATT